MWVRLIACANGNAVDCVTRDGGIYIRPLPGECVSVFLVSSTMFILEHIWAFGGDTESGFVSLVVISFLVFQEERRRDREDIGAT